MVLHRLVDVQVRAGGRVEPGEQLVHHDEQPHARRLGPELLLGLGFVGLSLRLAGPGHDALQQRRVRVVEKLLLRLGVGARVLLGDVSRLRVVGRDHGTAALEHRLLEELEVSAGFVDAGRHQERVPALARQAGPDAEVEDDVLDDSLHARARRQHLLHGAPLLPQRRLLPVVETFRLRLEPLVNLSWVPSS